MNVFKILKSYYKKYLDVQNFQQNLEEHDLIYDETNKLVMLRGEYKSYKNSNKQILNKYKKKNNGFTTNKYETDPLKQFENLSELQIFVKNNVDEILINQSYCFNASCGDGKTIATIYLMYILGLKTIIISSRNSVNDQWEIELKRLFPMLKISTRINENEEINDCDVLICTPQYLIHKIEKFEENKNFFKHFNFDLYVYDELHSLLSEQFSLTISLPFMLKMKNIINYLPYMIGLTASLPIKTSLEYKIIKTFFGTPLKFESKITKIPVYFTDLRDQNKKRGFCDSNYNALDDIDAFNFYSDFMLKNNILPSIEYKLIIMTSSIDTSIYCGIQSCLNFNLPVLIIRANDEKSFYLAPETIPDCYHEIEEQSEPPEYNINELKKYNLSINSYHDYIDRCAIIVGTYHRLKEGFNCKNIVYGICTKFVWSPITRTQILGRIRRNSDDKKLNEHKRIFFCNSSRIPSNIAHHKRYEKIEIKYDEKYEEEIFKQENYQRKQLNFFII